jgi:hypothetical protein
MLKVANCLSLACKALFMFVCWSGDAGAQWRKVLLFGTQNAVHVAWLCGPLAAELK